MTYAIRTAVAFAVLSLLTGSAAAADAPVCHPVHHHRAVHAAKTVVHEQASLGVTVDQARMVSFPEPVKTVYVGNPTVVDVSMVDPQHAFLLGKTFGITNMIALGPDGKQVSSQQVMVHNNGAAVTVNRGADQFNYMCTAAHCESSPRPGDPIPFVANTESSTTTHESAANGAATSVPAQSASN
jgi:hypothetical protein